MLNAPLFILESDDWGAGDHQQSQSLGKINTMLKACLLADGGNPVMTLGVTLLAPRVSVKDSHCVIETVSLAAPESQKTLISLLEVQREGLMPLQLHGRLHFNTDCLQSYMDSQFKDETRAENNPVELGKSIPIEVFPAEVQSRWCSAESDAERQAMDEVLEHKDVFGMMPSVAVPPTFVWNDEVEAGWLKGGITTLMTPGHRSVERDGDHFVRDRRDIANGDLTASGLLCLVRNGYFEPYKGVGVNQCLQMVEHAIACGRPAIIETHRWNYIHPDLSVRERCYSELASLLRIVVERYPAVASVSSEVLADRYRSNPRPAASREESYFILPLWKRIPAWQARLDGSEIPKLFRWVTGIAAILWIGRQLLVLNAGFKHE
ncbi:hypothetical protein [Aestuariirhabdus sp. LZHN29]|uniref:hypothetical protein n=1 Tax=Aestuariirhabdus sp. LZHN29 TaxID=3417462 RepID=UPI003CF0C7D3